MTDTQPTAHIIRNDEIGLTECGRLVPFITDTALTAPLQLAGGDVALWDNAETPRGVTSCQECWTAYTAGRCDACHSRPAGHGHFALYCLPCSELPYGIAAPVEGGRA